MNSRTRTQLLKLDPQSRLEQTCDTEVMIRISQGSNGFNAERVIASYDCETGPKHLTAHSLHYVIGNKIPHAQWAKHDLYD
jgi:hypothetical protein